MTKGQFIDKIEEVKPIMRGNWREVSDQSGVDYDTLRSYIRGYCPEKDVREAIIYGVNFVLQEIASVLQKENH